VVLLGKRCWMSREERNRLWYRFLVAHYGEVEGRIGVGGRLDLVWWKNLSIISAGDSLGVSNWFLDNLHLF